MRAFEPRLAAVFQRIDITPSYPVSLLGYFNDRVSTGVADPLACRLAAFAAKPAIRGAQAAIRGAVRRSPLFAARSPLFAARRPLFAARCGEARYSRREARSLRRAS